MKRDVRVTILLSKSEAATLERLANRLTAGNQSMLLRALIHSAAYGIEKPNLRLPIDNRPN